MRRWALAFLILSTISTTPALAEKALCSFSSLTQTESYRIEANKDVVSVTYQGTNRLDKKTREEKAEVLKHWFTGLDGGDALGISFIMLRFPNSDGTQALPAMIVIDWTTLRFGHSYLPLMAFMTGDKEKFLIARTDYGCIRLD
ncbi:hypothetical protein [Mesorhizobium sp. 131-2-1]|uniref:hypothetical protein n=1 Tax=Mesorhizobium sp. 131-2-1 TaxID=2744518 RepID=UPI001927AB34|nr:hypothetical protein [Mesorhizobium sp. 131-2-1]BCG94180.1 hypothetical protein MesoLj131a_30440 [Mesorhizobium sp. 131-2-1]